MTREIMRGQLLDESIEVSVSEICSACSKDTVWVSKLVTEGVLEPINSSEEQWRFPAVSLQRAHCAMRLERDLGVNLAGIALAIDLLEELRMLRARVDRIDDDYDLNI